MRNAKVIISENFGKQKPLNKRQKNKLIMEKFDKLTSEELGFAHSRKEIAKLLGYTDETAKAGAQVVGRLIKNKLLKEDFVGIGVDGFPENMYTKPGTPTEKKAPVVIPPTKPIEITKEENRMQVVLHFENSSMEIKDITTEDLIQIIKSL